MGSRTASPARCGGLAAPRRRASAQMASDCSAPRRPAVRPVRGGGGGGLLGNGPSTRGSCRRLNRHGLCSHCAQREPEVSNAGPILVAASAPASREAEMAPLVGGRSLGECSSPAGDRPGRPTGRLERKSSWEARLSMHRGSIKEYHVADPKCGAGGRASNLGRREALLARILSKLGAPGSNRRAEADWGCWNLSEG